MLIERFFGLHSPGYVTLTATLRLPIEREKITADDVRRLDRELRELAYHPENYLDGAAQGAAEPLVRQKYQWIATPATHENAKLRCHKIMEANQGMQPWLADRWRRLLEDRQHIASAMRTNNILASREYAFCLYPAEALRRLMEMP